MAIKKQEFYEGAALHALARGGGITSLKYHAPFFVLNDGVFVRLKYSTKGRSPWGFTFTPDEQQILRARASKARVVIGLIHTPSRTAPADSPRVVRLLVSLCCEDTQHR